MNIKVVMTLVAALIIVALAACGDTVSQSATGGGSNCNSHDGSCSIAVQHITEKEQDDELNDTVVEWTEDDPNCSVGSRAEGRC